MLELDLSFVTLQVDWKGHFMSSSFFSLNRVEKCSNFFSHAYLASYLEWQFISHVAIIAPIACKSLCNTRSLAKSCKLCAGMLCRLDARKILTHQTERENIIYTQVMTWLKDGFFRFKSRSKNSIFASLLGFHLILYLKA